MNKAPQEAIAMLKTDYEKLTKFLNDQGQAIQDVCLEDEVLEELPSPYYQQLCTIAASLKTQAEAMKGFLAHAPYMGTVRKGKDSEAS